MVEMLRYLELLMIDPGENQERIEKLRKKIDEMMGLEPQIERQGDTMEGEAG